MTSYDKIYVICLRLQNGTYKKDYVAGDLIFEIQFKNPLEKKTDILPIISGNNSTSSADFIQKMLEYL
jgi:hypothetical protein